MMLKLSIVSMSTGVVTVGVSRSNSINDPVCIKEREQVYKSIAADKYP